MVLDLFKGLFRTSDEERWTGVFNPRISNSLYGFSIDNGQVLTSTQVDLNMDVVMESEADSFFLVMLSSDMQQDTANSLISVVVKRGVTNVCNVAINPTGLSGTLNTTQSVIAVDAPGEGLITYNVVAHCSSNDGDLGTTRLNIVKLKVT